MQGKVFPLQIVMQSGWVWEVLPLEATGLEARSSLDFHTNPQEGSGGPVLNATWLVTNLLVSFAS